MTKIHLLKRLIEKLQSMKYAVKWEDYESGYNAGLDQAIELINKNINHLKQSNGNKTSNS